MSLDGGDRSPLIETDEIIPGDDSMSITSEKIIGADDGTDRLTVRIPNDSDMSSGTRDGEAHAHATGS